MSERERPSVKVLGAKKSSPFELILDNSKDVVAEIKVPYLAGCIAIDVLVHAHLMACSEASVPQLEVATLWLEVMP
jgi:hypothetical protein